MTLTRGPVTSAMGHPDHSYQNFDIEGSYSLCPDIDSKLGIPSATNLEQGKEWSQTPAGHPREPLERIITTQLEIYLKFVLVLEVFQGGDFGSASAFQCTRTQVTWRSCYLEQI